MGGKRGKLKLSEGRGERDAYFLERKGVEKLILERKRGMGHSGRRGGDYFFSGKEGFL